jgi:cytochrome oxidase Cu insertion factor (SCO1/SenC/PrrC family)
MAETSSNRGKLQLWLIIIMVAGVFIGGFVMMPSNEEEKARLLAMLGTSNKGTLLIPTAPMADLSSTQDGEPWRWGEIEPRWRLVLPVVHGCDQACKDMLYASRQVHIRLDKKAHRVNRVLLNLGEPLSEASLAFLQEEHVYLKVVDADYGQFAALLAATNADWRAESARLFVVDQNGEMMMYYTPDHDGSDMLADLRHLLRYSPEP